MEMENNTSATKKTKSSRAAKIVTPRDILRYKTLHPTHTVQEISNALEIPSSSVRGVLSSSAGRVLLEQLDKDSKMMLTDIRNKALARVSALLSAEVGSIPLKEEIMLLRLILTPVVANTQPAHTPPKLIFKTTISPRGTIDRTIEEDQSEEADPEDGLTTIEGEVDDEISSNLDRQLDPEY